MKYIVALIALLATASCGLPPERVGGPFAPGPETPYLLVDNNGTEDVVVYLYPDRERVGECVSLTKCELELRLDQVEDLRFGRQQIAYRRLGHRGLNKIMDVVQTPFLKLTVGRYDSGSWLFPRR